MPAAGSAGCANPCLTTAGPRYRPRRESQQRTLRASPAADFLAFSAGVCFARFALPCYVGPLVTHTVPDVRIYLLVQFAHRCILKIPVPLCKGNSLGCGIGLAVTTLWDCCNLFVSFKFPGSWLKPLEVLETHNQDMCDDWGFCAGFFLNKI